MEPKLEQTTDSGSDIEMVTNSSGGEFDTLLVDERQGQMPAEGQIMVQKMPVFNLLNSILSFPELAINMVKWVPPKNLLDLYAISKDFHRVMDHTFLSFIKASASIWAPYGQSCFPFQSFRRLCIEDPASRTMEHRECRAWKLIRHIPGIAWLLMVSFRHATTEKIIKALNLAGHRLPNYAIIAIQKVWFTMSFPSNGARIALSHNTEYWNNIDIFVATQFFMKMDMRFTDPTHGQGEHALRDIFLSQQSLVPLLNLITHKLNVIQILQYYILYSYTPSPQHRNSTIFGIPPQFIGRGQNEAWGLGNQLMLRVDEAIMQEALRRNIVLSNWDLDMITFGYQPKTDNTPIGGPIGMPRLLNRTVTLPDGPETDDFYVRAEEALPGINQALQRWNI
jgi:hypothetical protein